MKNEPARPLPPGAHIGDRELRLDARLTCPQCGRGVRPWDARATEHGFELICGDGHQVASWM